MNQSGHEIKRYICNVKIVRFNVLIDSKNLSDHLIDNNSKTLRNISKISAGQKKKKKNKIK